MTILPMGSDARPPATPVTISGPIVNREHIVSGVKAALTLPVPATVMTTGTPASFPTSNWRKLLLSKEWSVSCAQRIAASPGSAHTIPVRAGFPSLMRQQEISLAVRSRPAICRPVICSTKCRCSWDSLTDKTTSPLASMAAAPSRNSNVCLRLRGIFPPRRYWLKIGCSPVFRSIRIRPGKLGRRPLRRGKLGHHPLFSRVTRPNVVLQPVLPLGALGLFAVDDRSVRTAAEADWQQLASPAIRIGKSFPGDPSRLACDLLRAAMFEIEDVSDAGCLVSDLVPALVQLAVGIDGERHQPIGRTNVVGAPRVIKRMADLEFAAPDPAFQRPVQVAELLHAGARAPHRRASAGVERHAAQGEGNVLYAMGREEFRNLQDLFTVRPVDVDANGNVHAAVCEKPDPVQNGTEGGAIGSFQLPACVVNFWRPGKRDLEERNAAFHQLGNDLGISAEQVAVRDHACVIIDA